MNKKQGDTYVVTLRGHQLGPRSKTNSYQIHPEQTIPLMKNMKEVLLRYHPNASMWHSFQNFDNPGTLGWINIFLELLNNDEDEWLDRMVFAPAYEITFPELRDLLPDDMPIRRYRDITHTKRSQYPVLDWDPAFQKTLGREPINPRPIASVEIFKYAPCRNTPPLDSSVMEERTNMLYDFIGFISYSEGFNDDVNKIIWSGLGWDPDTPVEDILSVLGWLFERNSKTISTVSRTGKYVSYQELYGVGYAQCQTLDLS